MITTPSPDHGKDLLEEKVEAGTQNAKSSAARGNEFADASYSIIKKFRESAPEVAKTVKGS